MLLWINIIKLWTTGSVLLLCDQKQQQLSVNWYTVIFTLNTEQMFGFAVQDANSPRVENGPDSPPLNEKKVRKDSGSPTNPSSSSSTPSSKHPKVIMLDKYSFAMSSFVCCAELDVIYQRGVRVNVSSHIQKPRRELKICCAGKCFWQTSICLKMWWNTISIVWYIIFSAKTKTTEKMEKQ